MHQPAETDYRSSGELKYAIVEVIAEKGRASNIECGLLRGIGKDGTGTNFLWLVTKRKVSRACSLAYYNILSVVTFDGLTKTYTFFMADEDEQTAAIETVEKAYEGLKDLALPKDATLLDISKFQEVPNDIGRLSIMSSTSGSSVTRQTGAPSRKTDDWYGAGCGPGTGPHVTSDPEPCPWKRKTRKPTKKVLEALREKLDLIAKREYEFTARVIESEEKNDEEEEEEGTQEAKSVSHDGAYDEETFPFGP